MKSMNVNHIEKITIQVVEDSPTQSERLKYLLEEHGFHVRIACSCEEGLTQIKLQKPNLILCDIVMPGMDGYEFCHAIKTNDELKAIPVILLTRLSDPVDIIRGLEVMSDDYVIKPYDDSSLLSKIEKWLYTSASLGIQVEEDCCKVNLGGTDYSIHSSRQQMLNVLLSTYENAINKNRELIKTQSELSTLNQKLEGTIRELQVSEDRFVTLVMTIPDIVYKLDEKGRFTFINNAVCSLGYTPEELIGVHFSTIVKPEDADGVSRVSVLSQLEGRETGDDRSPQLFDERRTGDRKTTDLEVRIVCKNPKEKRQEIFEPLNQDYIIAKIRSSGLYELNPDTNNRVVFGTVGVIHNITELKRIQRELQQSHDELEIRIQKRTTDLVRVNKTLKSEISIREQIEEQQNLISRILSILNQPYQSTKAIEQILFLIKEHMGIEAVGIRLREGEDFPYYVTSGFSENFIKAERYLCSHDSDGEMIRDSQGNPYLECMCGNILCGRTNPSLPFFTRNGSFWTNDTTELLASTSEIERQTRTRNKCNSEGYQSVALIPLRSGKLIIGLLQLNDHKPNRFDGKSIAFLEEVGFSIGVALSRKQREEVIQKNEALYRTLIDSLPQYIFLKNDQYEFVSVNSSFCDLLGMKADDILGKTDHDLFSKTLADKYRDDDQRVFETGEMQELIEENIVGDNKKWVEVVKVPIKNADGLVTGVLGIFWDITERKNLEEQLRQSQKMEAIGQLAGGIAHDFNNLLMVIKGNCSFASQGLDPEDARFKDIEDIKLAAEHATALTRQLLAFSRRQVLQPVVLSINDLLVNMDKMLRRLIGEDIVLETISNPSLGFVKADPGQIEQIVMNLAVNARDAMPNGGRLTFETANITFDKNYIHNHQDALLGSYVMLAVSDTGCGMDEKTKERIFEPFYTTKEMGKGTGLGLATIYGIVKQSEGCIYVYSELGKGTTFKVYLPRIEEGIEIRKEFRSEGSLIGTETVLLVEDDKGVRQSVTRMLQKYNYTLVIAANAKEAIENYEKYDGKIDFLLTDVVMPGISGRELASHLLSLNPMLKVLYMSGYTDNAILHYGILDQGIHLIQKPFDHISLARKIRQILDKK